MEEHSAQLEHMHNNRLMHADTSSREKFVVTSDRSEDMKEGTFNRNHNKCHEEFIKSSNKNAAQPKPVCESPLQHLFCY